ncbi:glycoprotein, partial [Prochlorococcus marinus str. MU1417]|nr:glycoprotein [Prochlorococcus marinus str. MU1417]
MLLKNHLIEVFKKASSENNFLLKENIVLKWVHRFGIDSLSDLLIHSTVLKEKQNK